MMQHPHLYLWPGEPSRPRDRDGRSICAKEKANPTPRIDSEESGSKRDPEERPANCPSELREKMLDKNPGRFVPEQRPLSCIPDPCEDDPLAAWTSAEQVIRFDSRLRSA